MAGREYELKPLPIRRAREVRQRFANPVGKVIGALKSAPKTDLSDVNAMGELLDAVKLALVDSIDTCLELVFDFSEEMRADRERIETEAYDEEALAALVEVLKLLYPFGGLLKRLTGLAALATSMSSVSASGDDGPTSSTT